MEVTLKCRFIGIYNDTIYYIPLKKRPGKTFIIGKSRVIRYRYIDEMHYITIDKDVLDDELLGAHITLDDIDCEVV